MPLTPFHLGPALLFGALARRQLDLPTILVASVIVDVRAILVVSGVLGGRTHGILTTFLGGSVVALLLGAVVVALPRRVDGWLDRARLADTGSAPPVFAAAFVGVYSHVVLDGFLYRDVRPFYPLEWNPFLLGRSASPVVYGLCVVAGLAGLLLVVHRWYRTKQGA